MVVTEAFVTLARNEAEVLGMPDVRMVPIPHPLAGVGAAQIEAFADQVLEGILEHLKSK